MKNLLVTLTGCLFLLPGSKACAGSAGTSEYVFVGPQSTVLQTGGFAGGHWTYALTGKFRLTVDPEAGTASFDRVDATATDDSSDGRTLDPNEMFNLTGLAGKVVDETTIRFEGKVADGSSVVIALTFAGGMVTLQGETTPPPNSADFFAFTLDAVAQRHDPYPARTTEQLAFVSPRSTILQTGGFAGVRWTYYVEGQFLLTINLDVNTASLSRVDARATDDSPYHRTLDPNEVFNLTGLAGRVVDATTVRFEGETADGSRVAIKLTFADGTVTLQGETTPPPNSADFFVFTLDAVAQRQYAGGTGAPDNPYLIKTAEQLASIDTETDTLNVHFLLMNDLDLDPNLPGGCVFDRAVIGMFSGSFDGGGHTIRNLALDSRRSQRLGLFGYVGWEGQIRRLTLENARVSSQGSGEGYGTGALAGTNDGVIEDCRATGRVTGCDYVGGLVGDALGTIRDCSAQVTVVGGKGYCYAGGLVGWNCGLITNCRATGEVIAPAGSSGIGGLVGVMGYPGDVDMGGQRTISGCSAGGHVSVGDESRQLGGLVGLCAEGTITNCYASGAVVGGAHSSCLGGLVGQNGARYDFGTHESIISNCYATGRVSAQEDSRDLGGLVGRNEVGDVNRSFWDTDTSHQATSAGGTGKTTAQMHMASTFLSAGWDFAGETANGMEDIWWMEEGKDYPRLAGERVLGDDFGDGKAEPLWMVYQPAPESVWFKEVNGRLEVEAVAQTENVDAIYAANGWRLDATKDFALRVDFHFSKRGAGDGRVTFGVTPSLDPSGLQWAELEAGCSEADPFFLYEVRDGSWVREQTTGRSASDGTLYLSYHPDADELYFSHTGYGKANAWQTVSGLLKGRWAGAPVSVILLGGSEGMALNAGDAWLDNFVLDSGTLARDAPADEGDEPLRE